MNYQIKAYKVVSKNGNTTLEHYEKEVADWEEVRKEQNRLKELGCYTNIYIYKIIKVGNKDVYVKV